MRNQGSKARAGQQRSSTREQTERKESRRPVAGPPEPPEPAAIDKARAAKKAIPSLPVRPFQTSLAVPRCCVPARVIAARRRTWWHPRSRSPSSTGGILSLHDAQHHRPGRVGASSGQSRQCNVQFWMRVMLHCVMDKCLIQFFIPPFPK